MAIGVRLQKIGLTPDDIKYVVISHMHLDHGGNIAKFPTSTIIIEVRELIGTLADRHTILVTSHILGEIERVATRVAILLNGRLLTVQSLNQSAHPRLRLRVRSALPETVQATLRTMPG